MSPGRRGSSSSRSRRARDHYAISSHSRSPRRYAKADCGQRHACHRAAISRRSWACRAGSSPTPTPTSPHRDSSSYSRGTLRSSPPAQHARPTTRPKCRNSDFGSTSRPPRQTSRFFLATFWRRALDRAIRVAPDSELDYGDRHGSDTLRTALVERLGRTRGVVTTRHGHASITMTLDRYGKHMNLGADETAAEVTRFLEKHGG